VAGASPDFDWITPDLALGGCPACDVADMARSHGIGAVVDLRAEARDDAAAMQAGAIDFLHLPTEDLCAVSLPMLETGVGFARAAQAGGRRLLVHCQHGIGRSALLALCILVDRGMSPLAALALAKDARQKVSPSPAQFAAWADWLRQRGSEPPDFDAFRAIAYRHLVQA
jgi:predicted protein tyrosine phosphatase